ncbi:hypothetical protein NUSPORA_00092 [Nucleospora cyclopteri]
MKQETKDDDNKTSATMFVKMKERLENMEKTIDSIKKSLNDLEAVIEDKEN